MWTIVKAWLLKLILKRSFGGFLAALFALFLPIAAILKVVGIPLLFAVVGFLAFSSGPAATEATSRPSSRRCAGRTART